MIFIDGTHDYEAVTTDLSDWVPKVSEAGSFAATIGIGTALACD